MGKRVELGIFDGYPVTAICEDNKIYIQCKTVIGTLSDAEAIIAEESNNFGNAKIVLVVGNYIRIDCLKDHIEIFEELITKAKKLKRLCRHK